jgi:integrase
VKIEKANSAANTFEAIATELLEKKRSEGKAENTLAKTEWLFGLANKTEWLFGLANLILGPRPIREIEAPEILAVLRTVESRGKRESAKRLRATIGQVFRYAVATGRADSDPTGALAGALASPIVRHRAAIVEPKGFGALLRSIATYEGSPETLAALELLASPSCPPASFAQRNGPNSILKAVWSIPAEKMKIRRPHRVPLAPRAVVILRDVRRSRERVASFSPRYARRPAA